MIRIEDDAWGAMVAHAQAVYPNECCGAMLGAVEDGRKMVRVAVPLENAYRGAAGARATNCAPKTCWRRQGGTQPQHGPGRASITRIPIAARIFPKPI